MLKALMIVFGLEVLAFAVVGCGKETTAPPPNFHTVEGLGDQYVSILHDDRRHVTCWVVQANGIAISCLPDDKVTP